MSRQERDWLRLSHAERVMIVAMYGVEAAPARFRADWSVSDLGDGTPVVRYVGAE